VEGYRLAPRQTTTIGLALVADRPGIYKIGPVVQHAEIQGPVGMTFRVDHPYGTYGIMCVGVTKRECDAVYNPWVPQR